MKLLESYSLAAGQKVDKMDLVSKFFPLPFQRFILFQPFSKPSKNYDLWNEVLETIIPILGKYGITLVQTGGKGEPGFNGCYQTQGQTSIAQLVYLVENSLAVLSTDSAICHLAGHFNKPLVMLTSNNFANVVSPYFGDKSRQIILEPNKEKFPRPSFALEENPKAINSIPPESISAAIFKLLGLNPSIQVKTNYVGPLFYSKTVECVPDQIVQLGSLGINSSIVRLDYHFNEENAANQISTTPGIIVADKPINLDILTRIKPNLREIAFVLNTDTPDRITADYVKKIKSLGIRFNFLSYETDEKKKNALKFQFHEYGLIHFKSNNIPNEVESLDFNRVYYKTSKILLSNKCVYPSYAAYLEGLPVNSMTPPPQKIINRPEFWRDVENYYLLSDIS